METEIRPGFGRLVRAICRHAGINVENVTQTWTRTAVRNETELASIAQQSAGVVSQKTILTNHPWVTDVDKELKQIAAEEKEQQEKADQYIDAFKRSDKNSGQHSDEKGGDGVDGDG